MDNQTPFLGTEEQPAYLPTSDEKTMAILSHVLALPFSFIPPLIIYLIKKDESKFVAEHAKESLNFQITLFICYVISIVLMIIAIGILLMWAIIIADLVLVIIATIRASEGKLYQYPFSFRLIK